jgi:hypothetical protein
VQEAKKLADHGVAAGREYAEAHVQFVQYSEWSTLMLQRIQDIITGRIENPVEDQHVHLINRRLSDIEGSNVSRFEPRNAV